MVTMLLFADCSLFSPRRPVWAIHLFVALVGQASANANDSPAGSSFTRWRLSIGGVLLMLWPSAWHRVQPDSTVYLDAARNLANGKGLIVMSPRAGFVALTHYPPLYPAGGVCCPRAASSPRHVASTRSSSGSTSCWLDSQ